MCQMKGSYNAETCEKSVLEQTAPTDEERNPFDVFMKDCYFDLETFMQVITGVPTQIYLCIGDLQKDTFCISDNFKHDFNFPENPIIDFFSLFEKRLVPGDKKSFVEDLREVLEEKRTAYTFTYRLYDRNGIPVWMVCQGSIKWNGDRTKALFCCGVMVPLLQDEKSSPIEILNAAHILNLILSHRKEGDEILILVVVLRELQAISQILSAKIVNMLLQEVVYDLRREMGDGFYLIRMDRTCFLMVSVKPCSDASVPTHMIQQLTKKIYNKFGIHFVDTPCCIGELRCPRDGQSADELLEDVQVLVRRAESSPAGDCLEFTPEMLADSRKRLHLGYALNRCINHNFEGFRIVIQPQVCTDNWEIVGGEALLRWNYHGEDIPPSIFIPILERLGLMIPVGKWVAVKAIQACQRLIRLNPDFHLSFNVSHLQIHDDTFLCTIRRTMAECDVPGENLVIELTESRFDDMPAKLQELVEQCRKLGISVALDDYGTAYSSLQMLLQYPVDLVKADRSVTKEIASSEEKLNFIIGVISACQRFGKKFCVEGVETKEELDVISQTGCDLIQGFYLYRPKELEELEDILASKQTERRAEELSEQ